jgi:methylated-DNA-protein-cysteine methyltransferase-like protein
MSFDKISFFEQVYQVVELIPAGRVTSYGAIARYLGTGRSSRMVGWAMNASHTCGRYIPAHRVVNRNGLLTGKHCFEGDDTMAQLLIGEGIPVKGDQIVDFKRYFWDPTVELDIS